MSSCARCGDPRSAHAHHLPGYSRRALARPAYTRCSLCDSCPRYRSRQAAWLARDWPLLAAGAAALLVAWWLLRLLAIGGH